MTLTERERRDIVRSLKLELQQVYAWIAFDEQRTTRNALTIRVNNQHRRRAKRITALLHKLCCNSATAN